MKFETMRGSYEKPRKIENIEYREYEEYQNPLLLKGEKLHDLSTYEISKSINK